MPFYYHEHPDYPDNEDFHRALRRVWRSGNHVGLYKPEVRAYCRTVRLVRQFRRVEPDEVFATVPGGTGKKVGARQVWKGVWNAAGPWQELPNVRHFLIEQDYDSNGVSSGTIDIDNLYMEKVGTGLDAFHMMRRGYFSPLRGFKPQGRPRVGTKNDWFDILHDKSTQIILLAGYGDLRVPVFTGLLNDVDEGVRPDILTLTCRDGGQVLTDQQVFQNAKIRNIPDPITFADRRSSYKEEEVGHGASASSSARGHAPRLVLDTNRESEWISQSNSHKGAVEWIEITIPHGNYERLRFQARYQGMEMYVAIKARDRHAPGHRGAAKRLFGETYSDGEWIDEGKGNVPGTSIPYVKKITRSKAREVTIGLPDYGYQLGDDSRVRIYMTNLPRVGVHGDRSHRAGAISLHAVQTELKKQAEEENWILVDDAADIVKLVLQWAGINSMEVESTGVRIKEPVPFNRGNYLIDIIKYVAEQVNYVFYMKPPPSFDEGDLSEQDWESMGTAVFRQNQAMHKGQGVIDPIEMVHEDQVLHDVNPKFTDEPLAYNIRVRGAEVKGKKRRKRFGRFLGADRTKRWMYVYRPPWSRDTNPGGNWPDNAASNQYRNGNIKKYVVHYDSAIKSVEECKIASLFIAFAEALASAQCQIEAPAMPTIYLDHQTALFDTGSGLSTRVWIASRQLEYLGGEEGHLTMALGGSMIDIPDVQRVRKELVKALRDSGYNPGLSAWELENNGHIYRNAPAA